MESEKKKTRIIGPKIGNRRLNLKRFVPAAALAIGVLAGGVNAIAKAVSNDKSNKENIPVVETFDDKSKELDSIMNPTLDDVVQTVYLVNEEMNLYVEQDAAMTVIETIEPEQEINVFNITTENDTLGNEFLYCEIQGEQTIGLINVDDLSKATKVVDKSVEFDSIYQIANPSVVGKYMQATIGKEGVTVGASFKNGEIIFADKTDLQMDDDNNVWMKMRTNNGSIGYIQIDDTLQEIQDGILVEVIDSDKVSDTNTINLNTDVSNMITDVQVGSRLVVIGEGSTENTSRALYFDENGNAKWGEISNDLIKDVVLVTEAERLAPSISENEVEEINDVVAMNENISNWGQDYKNGAYGIDISGMKPDALKELINISPDISYGIIRLGVTGYGNSRTNLVFANNSTVTKDQYTQALVQSQIDVFKDSDIPVFGYFYGTDINPEEGYEMAKYIEECMDALDGVMQPIVDCEVFEEGFEDRMYFLSGLNYDRYVANGGYKGIDFDYMQSLDESSLLAYVKSNPEVQDYIEYCQDLKAQSLAAVYSTLYKDGYIKGKNALLYTGNKSVSKDSYIATITAANGNPFEKIVLFKYDDVVEYLTNPDSPYFISEDFALKVWYADYTGQQNFKMLGDGSVMAQDDGDVELPNPEDWGKNDLYDKNYACPEFIETMVEAAKEKDLEVAPQVIEDDDLELG